MKEVVNLGLGVYRLQATNERSGTGNKAVDKVDKIPCCLFVDMTSLKEYLNINNQYIKKNTCLPANATVEHLGGLVFILLS